MDPEITPSGKGVYRYSKDGSLVDSFPPEREARALVEGQILAKFVHARRLGYRISRSSRVLATGGASKNKRILQVFVYVCMCGWVYCRRSNSASF